MAHPHLSTTLEQFEARIQQSKNRLIAIPSETQRALNLLKQPDNHLVLVSIRRKDSGRWNHHYFKLTYDNEIAIPADVAHLNPGDDVLVKIHRVIPDVSAEAQKNLDASATGLLLELAQNERPGWRSDGSARVDEYLNEEIQGTESVR